MPSAGEGDDGESPTVDASRQIYAIVERHDSGSHELRVLEPVDAAWLEELASEYRRLRTWSYQPTTALTLDGVEILAVDQVQQALATASVPQYEAGNFGVARSDLAEVILGIVGEKDYATRYGYRSVRDRELVQRPGRGIDQIGVELEMMPPAAAGLPSRSRVTLVLGEAKVSSEAKCPPGVVDQSNDGLRKQHLGHLADREATADKVWNASRNCLDGDTQNLLRVAAELFRNGVDDGRLRIVAASLMVRPSGHITPDDFGTFHSSASDYFPAEIRFYIFRLPGDIDSAIVEFSQLAGVEQTEEPA